MSLDGPHIRGHGGTRRLILVQAVGTQSSLYPKVQALCYQEAFATSPHSLQGSTEVLLFVLC